MSRTRVFPKCIATAFLSLAALAAFACSSNPSASSVWTQLITAECTKAQQCAQSGAADGGSADWFAASYPNGVSQCVSLNPAPAAYANAGGACSQTQLNTCTTDINSQTCVGLTISSLMNLPPSCSSC